MCLIEYVSIASVALIMAAGSRRPDIQTGGSEASTTSNNSLHTLAEAGLSGKTKITGHDHTHLLREPFSDTDLDRVKAWLKWLMAIDCNWFPQEAVEQFETDDAWVAAGKRIPHIEECLERVLATDKCPVYRMLAARALACVGGKRSIQSLVRALRSDEIVVQAEAAAALGSLDALEGIDELCVACNSDDLNVRANACMALGLIARRTNRPADQRAVWSDKETKVRDSLERALNDADCLVRSVAQEGIREFDAGRPLYDSFIGRAAMRTLPFVILVGLAVLLVAKCLCRGTARKSR